MFNAPHERGFSLVELMIAMVLSLVALGSVIAVFLSSKQVYSTTETISGMQESARYSSQFIEREIRMAGYAAGVETGNFNKLALFPDSGSFAAGVVVFGTDNVSTSGVKAGSDILDLRYGGNATGQVPDCQGNAVASATIVSIKLFISSNDALTCQVGTSTPVALVEGIPDMQLTYGVDTNADRFANSYVTADSVTDWTRVAEVRVALTVAGSSTLSVDPRIVVSVVAVRNQLP